MSQFDVEQRTLAAPEDIRAGTALPFHDLAVSDRRARRERLNCPAYRQRGASEHKPGNRRCDADQPGDDRQEDEKFGDGERKDAVAALWLFPARTWDGGFRPNPSGAPLCAL